MELSLIRDIMELWEQITKKTSMICPIKDISTVKTKEMSIISQKLLDKYKNLECVRSDKKYMAEYSSFLLVLKSYWLLIPYYFYVDKTVGTLFYKVKNELIDDNGKITCDLERFFRTWWMISENHFGYYTNTDIKIMKAMVTLYDQETLYENPSSENIAKYLRLSSKYVIRCRERLSLSAYYYRALVNYGKLGFTTLAIWDLPEDIESELLLYRLMIYKDGNLRITVLSLPYEVNVLLQEKLINRGFPDELVIPLTHQGWNWNLYQLETCEKDSWMNPIRVSRLLQRIVFSQGISPDFIIEKPYLVQDIKSQFLGEELTLISPEKLRFLVRVLKDFQTFTWMAQESIKTRHQLSTAYEQLKSAGIINIRLDYLQIGLGAKFGLFLTLPDPLTDEHDPLTDGIITLIRRYPFSWILTGDRIVVACIVVPKKWAYDFYLDWSSIAQQCSLRPSKTNSGLVISISHPILLNCFYQLPWEDLWFEEDGNVVWKNPLT